MVELKRMPYAMDAYKTYRRPANENAGSLPIDDPLLANSHFNYCCNRYLNMADNMSRSGLNPMDVCAGLLHAALSVAKNTGIIDEYLDVQEKCSTLYRPKQ